MSDRLSVILVRSDAPPKPPVGDACNGCGVCCLAEPCPLGMVLSRRRRGPCKALVWSRDGHRYACGAMPGRPAWQWLRPAVARWIGAGLGCDSDAEVRAPAGP